MSKANPATGKGASGPAPSAAGDGRLPCQSPRRPAWKYLALAAVFAAWLAFLIYCAVAGNG